MRLNECRTALITGASRGLGLEIARAFATRGVRLVVTARGQAGLEAAARELRRLTEVVAIAGDIADADHATRLVAAGLDRFRRIDVLINNASTIGSSPMPRVDGLDPRAFEAILRVNAVAPLRLIRLVLPQMRARGEGVIVNVTSDAAVQAYPGWGAYGASKAALDHLTRVLAAELEGTAIRVYLVDPGDMNTQMHREAEPGADLSHLPGPEIPAPFFVRLVETETARFGRFEAPRAQTAAR